jgi:hypothetical protein
MRNGLFAATAKKSDCGTAGEFATIPQLQEASFGGGKGRSSRQRLWQKGYDAAH